MTHDSPVTELADALLEFTAPVTQILDHMVRAPQGDVDAAVATFRQLLADVLAPLNDRFARDELGATTAVIERATDLVLDEILLVPHD